MLDEKEMKNNIKAKMINELRDVAIEFHDFGCLREKLMSVVAKHMDRDWNIDTSYSLEGLIEDVKLRDIQIEEMKRCSNCNEAFRCPTPSCSKSIGSGCDNYSEWKPIDKVE